MKVSIRRNLTLPAGALLALVTLLGSTYSAQKQVRACRIPVEGEVDGVMLTTIQRRIDIALERGAEVIFFEIDSYGGRVDYAESIAHMIDTTTGVKKVAYIPNKAISAGAFIALSCDEIVMHPRATLGDCQPVFPSMTGPPKPAGEKMESAFRGKMVAYAQDENRNYPVALTKAMVSPRIEVLRIPGAEGLPHEFVEREDLYSWSETKLRDLQIFEESDTFSGGDERRRFVVIVDGEEVSIPIIVDEGEILTMHGEEAMEYGFARLLVDNLEELVSLYELKSEEVGYLPVLWWENFVKLLNSMPAKALLILVGLVGVFLEMKAPGFGLPGVVGIVCFVLLFYASHLAGLAQWIEIIMFAAGLILIAAEVFVIPGFGIAGIAGIVLALSGLILSVVSIGPFQLPSTSFHWFELQEAVTWIFIAIGAFVVALVVLARNLSRIPVLERIMLSTSIPAEDGYAAQVEMGEALIGKTGISRTVLRPAGKIEVEGVTYDAAAQGDFIEPGERIIILDTSGNRIIVRKD